MSHLYDNLLSAESHIKHDGEVVTIDEEMSPTTERLAVFFWLLQIDERLPAYISRVYAHDLQTNSLKDIQPQICQNLDSLIMELNAQDEVKVQYSRGFSRGRNQNFPFKKSFQRSRGSNNNSKSCAFCKSCDRPHLGHDIKSCRYLSDHDRNGLARALHLDVIDDDDDVDELSYSVEQLTMQNEEVPGSSQNDTSVSRVHCIKSPHLYGFYKHFPCKIVIDTGAESNCISLGLYIQPTSK